MHVHYPNVKIHQNKSFHCMFCKKEIRVINISSAQYLNKAYRAFTNLTFYLTVPLVTTYNHLHYVLHESLVVNLMIQNFAYLVLLSLAFLMWMAYIRIRYDFEEVEHSKKTVNYETNQLKIIPKITIKNLYTLFVFAPGYKTEDCILHSKNGLKLKPRGLSYQQYRCNHLVFDFILGELIAVNTAVIYHHAKFGAFVLPLYLALLIDVLLFVTMSFLYAKFRFAFVRDEQ